MHLGGVSIFRRRLIEFEEKCPDVAKTESLQCHSIGGKLQGRYYIASQRIQNMLRNSDDAATATCILMTDLEQRSPYGAEDVLAKDDWFLPLPAKVPLFRLDRVSYDDRSCYSVCTLYFVALFSTRAAPRLIGNIRHFRTGSKNVKRSLQPFALWRLSLSVEILATHRPCTLWCMSHYFVHEISWSPSSDVSNGS